MSAAFVAYWLGAEIAEQYVAVERDSGRAPDVLCNPMTDWAEPVTLSEIEGALSEDSRAAYYTGAPDAIEEVTAAFMSGFRDTVSMLAAIG